MIRKVEQKDLPRIIEIESMCFKHPWPDIFFESIAGHPGFLLYETDANILGYAIVHFEQDYGHLANIAVHPDHRRKGIGSELLKWCIEYTKQNGAHLIYLEVRTKNIQAREFYQDNSFRVVGIVPEYYPDDSAYIMAKKI